MPTKNFSLTVKDLANLPIFNQIEAKTLQEILQNSQIKNYQKNQSLFLEGEKANHFHIVLEGWVKIYKNNSQGEELVLKMAGAGQILSITSLLISPIFLMNAKITDQARILLIPTQIIKEEITNNKQLSDNIMLSAATQSQELFHHISELALKSTEERIALFLLNLFLENGKKLNSIKLPYDKSLIASYLGMKPESFSRGLKNLKKHKLIQVEGDIITLNNNFSLCNFCDIETSQKCNLHNKPECPNPQG